MDKYKRLSFEQRLHNAFGSQEMERKKAEHALVHAIGYEREEFDRLWFQGENSTWGHNFGRMVGWKEVYTNSVLQECEGAVKGAFEDMHQYYEYIGHDVRSVGACGGHALADGCIEVAEDGGSARGFFMMPGGNFWIIGGSRCNGYRRSSINWEYYGADFVYHNGDWVYIHEHVCPIFADSYDNTNWGHKMFERAIDDPDSYLDKRSAPCPVTVPGPLSMRYNIQQPVQHLLYDCPAPYLTLDDDNSYSPGHNELI